MGLPDLCDIANPRKYPIGRSGGSAALRLAFVLADIKRICPWNRTDSLYVLFAKNRPLHICTVAHIYLETAK